MSPKSLNNLWIKWRLLVFALLLTFQVIMKNNWWKLLKSTIIYLRKLNLEWLQNTKILKVIIFIRGIFHSVQVMFPTKSSTACHAPSKTFPNGNLLAAKCTNQFHGFMMKITNGSKILLIIILELCMVNQCSLLGVLLSGWGKVVIILINGLKTSVHLLLGGYIIHLVKVLHHNKQVNFLTPIFSL